MPVSINHSINGQTDIAYDGSGARAKKTVGAATDYYIGDHFEVIGGTATKYIFAGNLRIAMVTPTETSYFHKDHLGSSTVMTSVSGAQVESSEYMPFGHLRAHTGTDTSSYKFTDQEFDGETALYNYDARLYDPVIGRFISPDSIVPAPFNPQSLNRYSYVLNNPLGYTDPSGHYYMTPIDDFGLGGIFGDPGIDLTFMNDLNNFTISMHSYTDYYSNTDYYSSGSVNVTTFDSGDSGTITIGGLPFNLNNSQDTFDFSSGGLAVTNASALDDMLLSTVKISVKAAGHLSNFLTTGGPGTLTGSIIGGGIGTTYGLPGMLVFGYIGGAIGESFDNIGSGQPGYDEENMIRHQLVMDEGDGLLREWQELRRLVEIEARRMGNPDWGME
jgi:RHS repeat-associated protein